MMKKFSLVLLLSIIACSLLSCYSASPSDDAFQSIVTQGSYGDLPDTAITLSDEDGVELSAVIPDEESLSELEAISDRIAIEEAMSKMDEQWRRIIILRYYRNMTQHQTAVELGLTQVKVSREEKKIIEYLRAYFV